MIVRNNGQLWKKFSELNGGYYASFDTIWVYYPALTVHVIQCILMFKVLIRKVLPEVLRYTEIVYPSNVQYL